MSARSLFYPKDKSFSNAEEKLFARERLIYNTTEDILVLLHELDISKKELARRLGKSKSYVSQILSGARNMTLGTFSDICFVLDKTAKVSFTSEEETTKTSDSSDVSMISRSDDYTTAYTHAVNISRQNKIVQISSHPSYEDLSIVA